MINLKQKWEHLQAKERKWRKKKKYLEKKRNLQKDKISTYGFQLHLPSTSKLFTFFLFLNCTFVEIFTCYVTILNIETAKELATTPDLSPLMTLIGTVVGETIGFAIYAIKAAMQNCQGGVVYAMATTNQTNDEEKKEDFLEE